MYDHHQRYYVSPLADSDGSDIPSSFHLLSYGIKRVRAWAVLSGQTPVNESYGDRSRNGQTEGRAAVGAARRCLKQIECLLLELKYLFRSLFLLSDERWH